MTGRRFGGFWRRYFAYLIDKIILYLVSLTLFVTGMLALGVRGDSLGRFLATGDLPRGMGPFLVVYTVAMCITDMIYFTWFHGSVGRTPGKMLLGLRVIQASGEPMTFGVAFLRWVGSLVSGLFLWLGYLWIAVDGRKQGWHDKIAATVVVRTGGEADGRRSPAVAAQPSPASPPAASDPAGSGPAVAPPPAAVPVSDTDCPAGSFASDTANPEVTSAFGTGASPAGASASFPSADHGVPRRAGGAPGGLPGRG